MLDYCTVTPPVSRQQCYRLATAQAATSYIDQLHPALVGIEAKPAILLFGATIASQNTLTTPEELSPRQVMG
jgi:hypothetical protein